MSEPSWDQRFIDLMERIKAAAVAGTDPRPLHEELQRLMAGKPSENRDGSATS